MSNQDNITGKDQKITFEVINGKKYALLDGKVFKGQEEGQLKDWGPFFDEITAYWYLIDDKRKQEKNPYKQYVLNMQKDIVKEARSQYEQFTLEIKDKTFENTIDVSKAYQEWLIARIGQSEEEARIPDQPDYFYPAYRGQIKALKKIKSQFTGFALKP